VLAVRDGLEALAKVEAEVQHWEMVTRTIGSSMWGSF
jgi:hypothetical protein